jgi:hypothetical protein
VRTSNRRISAPHAKHFIAAPGTPLLTVLMVATDYAQSVVALYPQGCGRALLQEVRKGFGARAPQRSRETPPGSRPADDAPG